MLDKASYLYRKFGVIYDFKIFVSHTLDSPVLYKISNLSRKIVLIKAYMIQIVLFLLIPSHVVANLLKILLIDK